MEIKKKIKVFGHIYALSDPHLVVWEKRLFYLKQLAHFKQT